MYLLYKNIFSWENISRELIFANWVSEIANFTEGILWIPIRNLILLKVFSRFKTQKVNLAIILMSIKQNFLPQLNFPEETFSRIGQLQKHVLVKISYTKISYNIYNIYNRYLRNIAPSMFRERERERKKILATFLINIFFLVFYVNILFQNKNGKFQHKSQTINYGSLVRTG